MSEVLPIEAEDVGELVQNSLYDESTTAGIVGINGASVDGIEAEVCEACYRPIKGIGHAGAAASDTTQ
jgi:hypothetical protein